jgi:hypothetical protein
MSITVTRNGTDITSQVLFPSLNVQQNLTNEVDTASFSVRSTRDALTKEDGGLLLQENGYRLLLAPPPAFNDDIVISDGASVIFGGKIGKVSATLESPHSFIFAITCVEHSATMDRRLATKTYTNMTVAAIIADLITSYAPGFTTVNVSSTFVITKIVFNNVPLSQCLRRLADTVRYDWYVDENKDVHFFPAATYSAPYSLTDTAGNHVYTSLVRATDGAQLVNSVKVRGGEYDGTSFTDTVSGSATKSFGLPYQMSGLAISVDTGSGLVPQTVGIDFIDTFADFQVLYNFETQSFRFNAALAAGAKIQFTGLPKTPVLAVMQDATSIANLADALNPNGVVIEKFIRDSSILSNTVARKRAAAELLTYSGVAIDARFQTYTAGLRTGMLLNVNAAGFQDSLLIKRITFSGRTNSVFQYDVQCISTQRYSFIDLMRKIITPDPQATDETEVAEQLYPASDKMSLSDSASVVSFINQPSIITSLSCVANSTLHGSPVNFSFDCTGANALIFVIAENADVTAVTYNGVALTKDVFLGHTAVWRLNSPATGTNTIAVTLGASSVMTARAFAVSGMDTTNALAGTTTSATVIADLKLSVNQPSAVWSIGFMTRYVFDSGTPPANAYSPDGNAVEDTDTVSQNSPSAVVHITHQIFTRSGAKTMGSTYYTTPASSPVPDASMALYNGLPWM